MRGTARCGSHAPRGDGGGGAPEGTEELVGGAWGRGRGLRGAGRWR